MSTPYFSLGAYAAAVHAAIAAGQLEQVLVDVALKAETVKNDPLATCRVFGSPVLDRLCEAVGRQVAGAAARGAAPRAAAPAHVIYVCTETLGIGGHARVIADLIRADPGRSHEVVFTNLMRRSHGDLYTAEFEALGARISILPEGPFLDKLQRLLALLAAAPRSRLMLVNHHQDSVAVAAVAAAPQHERHFVHHCDFSFCLGVFLPGVVHVDLHTMGYHRCRHRLDIGDNRYWPLTCADTGVRHPGTFLAGEGLTTCCCGSEHKFTGRYPIDYFAAMAERLRRIPGRHVHIGPIDGGHRQHLAARLAAAGVAADRFVHVPTVPDLRQALVDHRVDVYLTSFPMGGGRALIEALAAGLPVVGHQHHRDTLLSGTDLLPAEAPVWTDLPELLSILAGMDGTRLARLSAASGSRYQAHHHPRLLAACVGGGQPLEPPPLRTADVEPMQSFLYEKSFLTPAGGPGG